MCTEGKTTTRVVVKYGSASQSTALRQEVKRIIVHPKFAKNQSPYFMVNDIALLELCAPLDMSLPGVKPICFTKEDLAYTGTVTITGWGKTPSTMFPDSLQHAVLNIYPVDTCKRLYTIFKAGFRDEWNKMCTFTRDKYPCDGDSGGALVAEVSPGCHIQVGITSYGTCTSRLPNVATKVSSFADWICESTSLC
ncbi:serine protease 52-like [Macrobrachium nipponense]|uniref:serine protease 52-like n=1 Tax=Macrobrachium nipponense TaxID=159736 RepID=UPI0030C84318